MSSLEQELREQFGRRLKLNQPLADYTSFGIGGPADLLVTVESEDELVSVLSAARRHDVSAFCLGGGTNLLVSDRGIRGLVVCLGGALARIEIDGLVVVAGAAVHFGELVLTVVERGLKGLEFGEGIPGTVGGALVMNAGAFGGEIAKVVKTVYGVSADGKVCALGPDKVDFAYRRTGLPPGFVVTRVAFELAPGDPEQLRKELSELRRRRAARQPAGAPNAGSIFKNPAGDFAAKLLEGAGLKGMRIGRAAFSEKHANFIVNLGGARAGDVRQLMEMARAKVKASSGVLLEPEVKLVGQW